TLANRIAHRLSANGLAHHQGPQSVRFPSASIQWSMNANIKIFYQLSTASQAGGSTADGLLARRQSFDDRLLETKHDPHRQRLLHPVLEDPTIFRSAAVRIRRLHGVAFQDSHPCHDTETAPAVDSCCGELGNIVLIEVASKLFILDGHIVAR